MCVVFSVLRLQITFHLMNKKKINEHILIFSAWKRITNMHNLTNISILPYSRLTFTPLWALVWFSVDLECKQTFIIRLCVPLTPIRCVLLRGENFFLFSPPFSCGQDLILSASHYSHWWGLLCWDMLAGQIMHLIAEFCAYFCNIVCKRKKMSLKRPKVICELEYVVLKWNVLWQKLYHRFTGCDSVKLALDHSSVLFFSAFARLL